LRASGSRNQADLMPLILRRANASHNSGQHQDEDYGVFEKARRPPRQRMPRG
jgi:hypothetical protein